MNSNVFNKSGDFITSPEISQIFGEMIGIWIAHFWETVNLTPDRHKTIIEFGAGTGKLMSDVLSTLRQVGHVQNYKIIILEVSPFLTNIQQTTLNKLFLQNNVTLSFEENKKTQRLINKKHNIVIEWIKTFTDFLEIEKEPQSDSHYVFVNNEFFDALPVLKFKYIQGKWHEIMIDLKAENKPHLLLTSNQATQKFQEPKNKEHYDLLHTSQFINTLSAPNTNAVIKLLKPEYRFQNKNSLKEGLEFELCPFGFFNRHNYSQFNRGIYLQNKWGIFVY